MLMIKYYTQYTNFHSYKSKVEPTNYKVKLKFTLLRIEYRSNYLQPVHYYYYYYSDITRETDSYI